MRRLAGPSSACYRCRHARYRASAAPRGSRGSRGLYAIVGGDARSRAREAAIAGGARGGAGPDEGRARRRGPRGRPPRSSRLARGRALVLVNDRADLALLAGADGVHVGDEDLPPAEARRAPRPGPARRPHHAARSRRRAPRSREGADHVGFGPIFPSRDEAARGRAARARDARARSAPALAAPVVAIGGIDRRERRARSRAAGAACAAVIGALFGAGDAARDARPRSPRAFEAGRARGGARGERARASASPSTRTARARATRCRAPTSTRCSPRAACPSCSRTRAAAAAAYLALLDGLVVTGGAFDVPPELYGEARRAACGPTKPERTDFERELSRPRSRRACRCSASAAACSS